MTIHTLHGAMGSLDDWSTFTQEIVAHGFLAKSHDLWSHLLEGGVSYPSFAAGFNRAINEEDDKSRCLVGYSMGGRLALHALLHDQLSEQKAWGKAVIVSAHTGVDDSDVRAARAISDEKWADLAESLPWEEFIDQWNQQGVLQHKKGGGLQGLADRSELITMRSAIAESFRCWSLGKQEDLLESLSKLEIPVLWVVGELDQKFCAIAQRAVSVMPHAELKVVRNVGHRVPWEAPDDFSELVRKWLEK